MNKGKKKNKVKKFIIWAAVLIALLAYLSAYSGRVVKNISNKILRLHIVAESNSPEDQEIKLAVRDEILACLEDKLSEVKSLRESEELVRECIPEIEAAARRVVERYGKEYGVKAEFGYFSFPPKEYENIRLPAGNYNALRVTLGNGGGENWWCVLFPPLCFMDSAEGKISDESREDLKKALPEEEYRLITSTDDQDDIPVRIKFKIVDIIEESKNVIRSLIASIFG